MSSKAPHYWQEACDFLSQQDPVMGNLIKQYKDSYLPNSKDAYTTLCRAVIGQQISVQAADTIWMKFSKSCSSVTPLILSRKHMRTLQSCGLSKQKSVYIKEIAKFFLKNKVDRRYWKKYEEEEIFKNLTEIKGVGKWTFEMFAIFYLRSPNILPLSDLGLIKAIEKEYKFQTRLQRNQVEELAQVWHPWKTVATWYLWRSVDPKPVKY